MTQTLKQFTANQRASLLARIAERYLPNPGIDPPPEVSPDDAANQERILKEIKTHLGIAEEETPEDKQAIIDYLSENMSRAVLENADLKAIEDRLNAAHQERLLKEIKTQLGIAEEETLEDKKEIIDSPSESTSRESLSVKALTLEQLVSHLLDENVSAAEASAYFVELIQRFEPLLRRVWAKGGFSVSYEDYVQDVFVQLFARLPRLQRNPKAFPGYLRRIALSVAADHARKQRRSIEQVEAVDVAPQVARFEEEINTEIFVRYYLEHLSRREKEVMELIYLKDLPVAQIAKKFGITPGAVRTTKSRAIGKMRKLMLQEANDLDVMYEQQTGSS